jgi:hypothetical protein
MAAKKTAPKAKATTKTTTKTTTKAGKVSKAPAPATKKPAAKRTSKA